MKTVYIDFNASFGKPIFTNNSLYYSKDINRLIIDNVKEIIVEHQFITIRYIIKPNYKTIHKETFDILEIKNMVVN